VFIEVKDDGGGGDNWTTGAISCTKLQSNHHHQQTNIQFFTGQMPLLSPKRQCQSTEGKYYIPWTCLPKLTWWSSNLSLTTIRTVIWFSILLQFYCTSNHTLQKLLAQQISSYFHCIAEATKTKKVK